MIDRNSLRKIEYIRKPCRFGGTSLGFVVYKRDYLLEEDKYYKIKIEIYEVE